MKVLEEYKDLIENTSSDLEDQLTEMNEKLKALQPSSTGTSDDEVVVRQQVQEEMDSFQQCLKICEQVSAHIDHLKPQVSKRSVEIPRTAEGIVAFQDKNDTARILTVDALEFCKEKLQGTSYHLQALQEARKRAQMSSTETHPHNEKEEEWIRKELESTRQCLEIVNQASKDVQHERINVYEEVSSADDSHQVIVSTVGDLICAKKIKIGSRSRQYLGQMSDESLQSISRSYGPISTGNISATGAGAEFEDRYGPGRDLHRSR
jgi:DNA repair exonuclease SbcCD ATPase subunit